MMLLALDTSTKWMTAALLSDAGLVVEHTALLDRRMLAQCPARLETILLQACVTSEELTACAAGLGPGSYTGLRIGLSIMQGIAFARQIPLHGVASSAVLASAAGERPLVYLLQESGRRTGHAAFSAYDTTVFPPRELLAPRLIQPAELPELWRGHGIVIGDAAARVMGLLPEIEGSLTTDPELSIPRAATLARIATHRWNAGDPGDPAAIQGIYLATPPLPQRKAVAG
ncbi:tRNA (adenosine(37)-N6)-threonylcarbamoyltransferase complex dimerization subunit type 1 TsaB [Candidatus Fermentibacteria bacterium]|nr:tRNA (adenosine(37)-N6)-threonylcarbamoyltransferase complex dimerization subunit type 1 TsaB [Candidatus Fermentibacteria bacterium]